MNKAVNVYRGGYVESSHLVHIAVVDCEGKVIYSFGDPSRLTFARSSMKPFQAIPLLETGAAKHFHYGPADISLSCASHSGEHRHRSRVLSILDRVGKEEEVLQCGTHIPRDLESYKELIREGKELSPVYSNCSGKHSGMVATAVHMNEDVKTYYLLDHPVQQRILEVISEMCHYPKEKIGMGVDGCGVPVHRLPLNHIAYGFARLAYPESIDDESRAAVVREIRDAMIAHPEMVGGEERFDTDLMNAYGGRIVAKAGAESVQCLGDLKTGIGIAIKVEDGSPRAISAVTMEVLKQLGIGDDSIYRQLETYAEPIVKNMREEQVGSVKAEFTLNKMI